MLHVTTECRNCRQQTQRVLQFFYGKRDQDHYALGDSVAWWPPEHEDWNEGGPARGRAWLPSYSGAFPECGHDASFADFAIIVQESRLVSVVQAPPGQRFREDVEVVPMGAHE
jgi:hypothetical protein